ncbi:MAG: hypothetical protein OXR67_08025 [Chloroflexota bacterium]|nr:hypothetical protein [Chloroflexota bacterium]
MRPEAPTPTGTSRDIGGALRFAQLPGFVALRDETFPWGRTRLVYFRTEVAVAVAMPGQENANVSSLLGWDVIDRYRMLYEPARRRLELHARQADGSLST